MNVVSSKNALAILDNLIFSRPPNEYGEDGAMCYSKFMINVLTASDVEKALESLAVGQSFECVYVHLPVLGGGEKTPEEAKRLLIDAFKAEHVQHPTPDLSVKLGTKVFTEYPIGGPRYVANLYITFKRK